MRDRKHLRDQGERGLKVTESSASSGDVGTIWKGAQVLKKAADQPRARLLI
jgi:hypothetical protein